MTSALSIKRGKDQYDEGEIKRPGAYLSLRALIAATERALEQDRAPVARLLLRSFNRLVDEYERHGVITVNVQYGFTGFFPPVDNLPTLNVVNAGRAVPVKFSLGGYYGLNILVAGYPSSSLVACGATAEDAVEETVSAGSSSPTYIAGASEHIPNTRNIYRRRPSCVFNTLSRQTMGPT